MVPSLLAAGFFITIPCKAPLPPGEGAIAPEIFKHRLYSYFLDKLCWDEKFDKMIFQDCFEELLYIKASMKAAANYTRDHMQAFDESSPLIKSQSFAAIARAVWTQHLALADTLLLRSHLARDHLEIVNEKITLKNPS